MLTEIKQGRDTRSKQAKVTVRACNKDTNVGEKTDRGLLSGTPLRGCLGGLAVAAIAGVPPGEKRKERERKRQSY